MGQFIVVWDSDSQNFVNSGETVQSVGSSVFSDQDFEVTAASQTNFQSALPLGQARIDIFANGILQREGALHDYIVNSTTNQIVFNSPVFQSAWVRLKIRMTNFDDFHFDTTTAQSNFAVTVGKITNNNRLEVYVNGVQSREGSGFDYQRNVASSRIEFNSPVLANAWVLVRTYS